MIKTERELSGIRLAVGALGIMALIATPIVLSEAGVWKKASVGASAAEPLVPPKEPTWMVREDTTGCISWKVFERPDNCEVYKAGTNVGSVVPVDKRNNMRCVSRKIVDPRLNAIGVYEEAGCRWVKADSLIPN
jgi:hypothetical protein